jgi:hypothetical protein
MIVDFCRISQLFSRNKVGIYPKKPLKAGLLPWLKCRLAVDLAIASQAEEVRHV